MVNSSIEVKWSTDTVWLDGIKVAAAVGNTKHPRTSSVWEKGGWILPAPSNSYDPLSRRWRRHAGT